MASARLSTRRRDSGLSFAAFRRGASTSGSGARCNREISVRADAVASAITMLPSDFSLTATRLYTGPLAERRGRDNHRENTNTARKSRRDTKQGRNGHRHLAQRTEEQTTELQSIR